MPKALMQAMTTEEKRFESVFESQRGDPKDCDLAYDAERLNREDRAGAHLLINLS